MLIKLTNGKVSTKHQFDDDCSYIAFIQAAAEVVHIPEEEIELLVGFPPKLLQPSDPNELVRNLGVVSGTAVTVRPNPDRRNVAGSLKDMGFSSHIIVQVIHSMKTPTFDEAVELCTLAVSSSGDAHNSREKKMVIWTIPADNSCLFNAIDFLVNSPTDLRGPGYYRRIVADVILANPALYSEDFLEKKPSEYVTWILHPDKWGGEIELSILSTQLTIEIAVVDIQTGISLVYGSGSGYDRRIFLIYDGSHYDAVVRSTDLVHSPPHLSCIERSFAAGADDLLDEVKELALDRRKKRQFTNLRSGSLLCKQCDCVFTGQKEAVEHAKQTGHTNFGEVV